ncbi:hypothetical protein H0H93_006139 [Arthromyces matolae]|nr:hypothetical protein H0H93_006139 [Arthromyces matolae]
MFQPHPELIFLSYSEDLSGGQLTANKQLSLYERTASEAVYFTDIVVHPSGKAAVVSCYKGKLRVIKFKAGNHEEDFDVVLRELNLLGLEFLPVPDLEYALAILHIDYQGRVQLLARDCILEDLELSSSPSTTLTPTTILQKEVPYPEDIPLKLLPVHPQPSDDGDAEEDFLGGILVIGGRSILMFELASVESRGKQRSKKKRLEAKKKSTDAGEAARAREKEKEREGRARKVQGSVQWPWSEVTAVCAVDPSIPRFILGDSFGQLSLLSAEDVKKKGLLLLTLGEASPASSLTYLTSQTLYLGSHLGNSQLLQISQTPVSSLPSPARPIPSEIQTVTPRKLSQALQGKGKARERDDLDDVPAKSTKGMVLEPQGSFISVLEEYTNIAPIVDAIPVDIDGSGERQIVTCSGGGNKGSLHIIRNGAEFEQIGSVPGLTDVVRMWTIRDEFEDSHDAHLLVSTLEATHILRIDDESDSAHLTSVNDAGLTGQSGLVVNEPTLAFGNVARRVIGSSNKIMYQNSKFVVQVTKQSVAMYNYDTISKTYEKVASWDLKGSVIVAADLNASQVVLAMRGGRLLALTIEDRCFKAALDNTTGKTTQGPEISAVSCMPIDESKPYSIHVVVAYWDSKTVTIFFWEKKRLQNSPIMLKDVTAVTCLNSSLFRSSLLLATPTSLLIGRIGDLAKKNIQAIPLGLDNPFRITYEPSLKVFGVGVVRHDIYTQPARVGDPQCIASSFKLLDDVGFNATYTCEQNERIASVATYTPEVNGSRAPIFCLGVHVDEDEIEPSRGKLLLLSATHTGESSRFFSLHMSTLAEADVKGCVYAISFIKDIIVAAVNSSVIVFKLQTSGDVSQVVRLGEWNHNYMVTSLVTHENRVMIGDHLNSVSMLEVVDGKIKNLARDYGPRWPVAVEANGKDSMIGANLDSNLVTFKLTNALGRSILECDGNYYLADFVTKFTRGSLTSDSTMSTSLEASQTFFTSSGRIGVIVEVTDATLALNLTALQRNLAAVLTGIGGESHTRFRAPKNIKGRTDADPAAYGFIDGDFLERFLHHLGSPDVIEKVMAGHSDPERLLISVEEIQSVLENIQSFH